MTRGRLRIRWFPWIIAACLACSLGLIGYVRAQTPLPQSLRPNVQTVRAAAFDSGRRGIVATPDGITTDQPLGTVESPVTAAPAPFTYLMLRWHADVHDHELIQLFVRASADQTTWTPWGEVHENEDLADPAAPDVHWSGVVYAGPSSFWQLRVVLKTAEDGTAPVLREVRVHTVDSRGPEPVARKPAGAVPGSVVGRPAFVPRGEWGGSEVLNNSVGANYYQANHLVLHHTADSNSLRNNERNWGNRVRAIWAFHSYPEPNGRGWGDIGYNWLVAPDGEIFEGRNGSSNLDRDAVGFHDAANYGSMGVAIIGTLGNATGSITPPEAAQRSVVELFAWKGSQRGIDPLGRSFYYGCSRSSYCAPYNPGSIVQNIAGHRQVRNGTSCPGDLAMNVLDSIRQRVRDRIDGAQPPPPPPPPSPTTPPPPPPTPTPVPAREQAELVDVQFVDTTIEHDGVLQVRFTVRNTGDVTLATQAPQPGSVDNSLWGRVYDESNCFIGDGDPSSYPAHPKEDRRLRIVLGGDEGGTPLGMNCAGNSGGYPWRWGLEGDLRPGETRTVVGYVRFRNLSSSTRELRLRAGLVHEQVRYFAANVAETTVWVTPERKPPQLSAMNNDGQPLAFVYRLAPVPWDLIDRAMEPSAAQERELVGSFAWDGSLQSWGDGGPFGLTDHYIVNQVRPVRVPHDGVYSFELTSDDGSWLWVDGIQVVSNPGLHPASSVSGSIWLSAGVHSLAVKYVDYVGSASVRYSWRPWFSRTYGTIPVSYTTWDALRKNVYGQHDRIVLLADDLGGQGTRSIEYSVDFGAPESHPGGRIDLTLPDGGHWISYRATDYGGVQSHEQRVYVVVDATPPQTSLTSSTGPTGVIWLSWSSDPDALLFELQVREPGTGNWIGFGRTSNTSAPFIGRPGQTYQFRIRAWDGLNWEQDFKESQSMPQTVPADARFHKTLLPIVGGSP